jgi:hypothetical protein
VEGLTWPIIPIIQAKGLFVKDQQSLSKLEKVCIKEIMQYQIKMQILLATEKFKIQLFFILSKNKIPRRLKLENCM